MRTIPATVEWRFEDSLAGPVIIASIAAPTQELRAELTMSHRRTEELTSRFDLVTHVTVSEDHPGFQNYIWVKTAPNLVGHRESTAFVDPFNGGEIEPDTWLMGIGLDTFLSIVEAELLELGAGLNNATYAFITLEMGESGRAAFAEAMAAWGIGATPP